MAYYLWGKSGIIIKIARSKVEQSLYVWGYNGDQRDLWSQKRC